MAGHTNPILLDIPDRFETERLLIRIPRPGDGQAMNDAIRDSHEHLKHWMPWAQTVQPLEESETLLRKAVAQFILREQFWLLLFRKSDGYLVGSSGLHNIDWSVPSFEIGYWVRADCEGQGYITEAVNGITDFTFDTLQAERIEIRCDSRNDRSAAVARRAGYTLDGHFRHHAWAPDATLRDTLIFSKLREDWLTSRTSARSLG